MNANIDQLLKQRFECPGCHASGSWEPSSRAMVRTGSTIHGFRCRSCDEEIVVKVPRTVTGAESNRQLAQKEYRALCDLQTAFPQDEQFGTLTPLGYLEHDGCAAIITRKFAGADLIRHSSRLDGDRARGAFRRAGVLLRKLHDSCPRGYQPKPLGVADKVAYLTATYRVQLSSDLVTRTICTQFEQAAGQLSTLQLRATWGHGDFKAENILCNAHKYIILDTQLGEYGSFVYDLASFLNHLLLAGPRFSRSGIGRYQQAEDEFLSGYGGVSVAELSALRWAQLYFMLCYLGRYRQRGLLGGIFANWKIRPLLQKLAAQL